MNRVQTQPTRKGSGLSPSVLIDGRAYWFDCVPEDVRATLGVFDLATLDEVAEQNGDRHG